jgi:regulator of sigma E protease
LHKTWDLSAFSLEMLGRMVIGEASLKNLSGPVTIADFAGRSAEAGLAAFIGFLALISVSLASSTCCPSHYWMAGICCIIPPNFDRPAVSETIQAVGQKIGAACWPR